MLKDLYEGTKDLDQQTTCSFIQGFGQRMRMNRIAFLLLVSGLCVHAAEIGVTNLVVTPLEVDPKSVTLTAAESRMPNVEFNYLNKTPEQIRAMSRRHPPGVVMKDGVVVAKAVGCAAHKDHIGPDGHLEFAGLTLGFDDLEQARIAAKVLRREDKEPQ